MSTRWSWTIALLLSGCAHALAPDMSPDPDPAPPAADPGDRFPRLAEPPDPCASPVAYQAHGFLVFAPAACLRFYRDEGDPPPDQLRAPDVTNPDPSMPVAPVGDAWPSR